jgi:hypothetical protein
MVDYYREPFTRPTKQEKLKAMLMRNYHYEQIFSLIRQQRSAAFTPNAAQNTHSNRRKKHWVKRGEMARLRTERQQELSNTLQPPQPATILPEAALQVGYVDLDIVCLWNILQSQTQINGRPTQSNYYENKLYAFCKMFKIDHQYLLTLENGHVPADRWFFNNRITTDGLSTTVHCARWVLFQKLPTRRSLLEAERRRRREIAVREEERARQLRAQKIKDGKYRTIWGCDPGAGTIGTLNSGGATKEFKHSIGSKQYHTLSKLVSNRAARTSWTPNSVRRFYEMTPKHKTMNIVFYRIYLR